MTAPNSFFKTASSEYSSDFRSGSSLDSISLEQVVFCDFDGPIVDVSERYYQTYRKGLQAI